MGGKKALAGLNILVTRPEHQAEGFSHSIESMGGSAVRLPVLAIESIPYDAGDGDRNRFDFVFFVSSNAVKYGIPFMPDKGSVVAVGSRTAEALVARGVEVTIKPDHGFTSEDLLALPSLQKMGGKSALIFRGQGGREALAKTLCERGASVEYAEVYRRFRPDYSDQVVDRVLSGEPIDVVAITSIEGLKNLKQIAGARHRHWLDRVPLLLGSKRMQAAADKNGLGGETILASDPTDPSMLKALTHWAESRGI
ncbi:MAG: uroporphyrinogen-III synthase [bacterium]